MGSGASAPVPAAPVLAGSNDEEGAAFAILFTERELGLGLEWVDGIKRVTVATITVGSPASMHVELLCSAQSLLGSADGRFFVAALIYKPTAAAQGEAANYVFHRCDWPDIRIPEPTESDRLRQELSELQLKEL